LAFLSGGKEQITKPTRRAVWRAGVVLSIVRENISGGRKIPLYKILQERNPTK